LTATVAALELDARNLSSTVCLDFDCMNDEDSSVHENVDVAETSSPFASSVDDRDTDDELESEDAPVDASTTMAQQVQMHLGSDDANDGNADDDNTNPGDEPEIKLTPVDCATLDVLIHGSPADSSGIEIRHCPAETPSAFRLDNGGRTTSPIAGGLGTIQ
jgi:hypothetical protein